MARYMMLWEMNTSKIPDDPKTKKAQWLGFQEIVVQQLKEGSMKEWGAFAGEMCGYAIFEGNAVDLHTRTAGWVPFVKFKVGELLTIEDVNKATKALPD